MADINDTQVRVKAFLLVNTPPGGTTTFSDDENLPEFARTAQRPFSAFDPNSFQMRNEILENAIDVFENAPDPTSGVDAAMEVFEAAARGGNLALAQHVLGVFSVHAPKIRSDTPSLPVPPGAFRREAGGVVPFGDEDEGEDDGGPSPVLAGEDLIHWFREDLYLNEHHRHWHFVYNAGGIPLNGGLQFKSRQGEVFVYMHQQMLARYDTERQIANIDLVESLEDISGSLGAGYDPRAREPKNSDYIARVSNASINAATAADLENRRENVRKFITDNGVVDGRKVGLNAASIGTLLESNFALGTERITMQQEFDEIDTILRSRFHLHNFGHGAIAGIGAQSENEVGVMSNPHTSLQDPVFWRWHRMIDDVAQEYYSQLPAYEFDDTGIEVVNDGIVLVSQVATGGVDFAESDRETLGISIDDYARQNLTDGMTGASTLHTGMYTEDFEYSTSLGTRNFNRASLFCEKFAVVAKVVSDSDQEATARLFICADAFLDMEGTQPDEARRAIRAQEHRFWIELDRKPVELKSGDNLVRFISDESNIVRKLSGFAPWPTSSFTEGGFDDLHGRTGNNDDYCDCGWPLNLHLPRGKEGGMSFQMMVHISPGIPDGGEGTCGSRAFCGARFDTYPELPELNLGYPFDRSALNGTVALVAETSSMAMRTFSIEHVPELAVSLGLPAV